MSKTVKIILGIAIAAAVGVGGWFGWKAWQKRRTAVPSPKTADVAQLVKAAAPSVAQPRPTRPPAALPARPAVPPDRGITPAAGPPSAQWNQAGDLAKGAITSIGGALATSIGIPAPIVGGAANAIVDGVGGFLQSIGIKF